MTLHKQNHKSSWILLESLCTLSESRRDQKKKESMHWKATSTIWNSRKYFEHCRNWNPHPLCWQCLLDAFFSFVLIGQHHPILTHERQLVKDSPQEFYKMSSTYNPSVWENMFYDVVYLFFFFYQGLPFSFTLLYRNGLGIDDLLSPTNKHSLVTITRHGRPVNLWISPQAHKVLLSPCDPCINVKWVYCIYLIFIYKGKLCKYKLHRSMERFRHCNNIIYGHVNTSWKHVYLCKVYMQMCIYNNNGHLKFIKKKKKKTNTKTIRKNIIFTITITIFGCISPTLLCLKHLYILWKYI